MSSIHKNKVLEIVKEIREELEFYVIAYCIMDNHMHLLIKIDEEKLGTLMKKINVKYAMYYNKVEKRYGHVFQDGFKSEAVEDVNYLIGVLRYIHNNPVKAGIVKNIEEYKWNSVSEYIKKEELAEILLKLDIISYRDIANICNLSYYKVADIGKGIKSDCIN
ncbi:transposase [Sedimentibacter sp. zth1]|uniref:transposase n=1 Tax=Sedimentibacter sp. zth1 TaxID=2816908 RepID=UPI001A91653B|nr:transposase [Sedimentibacter sp. zth1]